MSSKLVELIGKRVCIDRAGELSDLEGLTLLAVKGGWIKIREDGIADCEPFDSWLPVWTIVQVSEADPS